MFSRKMGYKIIAKVHGKGGIFSTSRLAYVPLLDWTAVTGKEGVSITHACMYIVDCLDILQIQRKHSEMHSFADFDLG